MADAKFTSEQLAEIHRRLEAVTSWAEAAASGAPPQTLSKPSRSPEPGIPFKPIDL